MSYAWRSGAALSLAALAALAFLSLPGVLTAQQPEGLPGVFGEVIEVRVINLEVVVTDKDGVRVPGLRTEDFRLLVDGDEVPIEYFTEIRGGTAVVGEERAKPGIQNVPAVSPGKAVGTSFLVFVDDFFAIGRDRNLVLKRLKEDLPLLGADDRMAVVAYDGRGVEMLSSWSSSVPALEKSLEKAMDRPALGLQRLAEQRQYDIDQIFEAAGLLSASDLVFSDVFGRLDPDERFYAAQLAEQVERSVAAAAATLRGFANPPGRKVMLLLAGGWPFLPAEFVVADFARPIFIEPGIDRGTDLFRSLTDTANLLGYTLYPIDVPGIQVQAADASRRFGLPSSGLANSTFLRETEVQFTLEYLAEKTGGRALINAQREEALAGVVSDTRSYYWIGFTPSWEESDKRHEVVVEVRDPKLKVRSRSSFLDSSRKHEVTMAVESALLFGNPPSREPLAIGFGRAKKQGSRMEVPLVVGIPLASVTVLPSAGEFVADLELRVAVLDKEGRRAEIPVVPVTLRFGEEPPDGGVARYDTTLKMRREKHDVVVAIYDRVSGRILSGAGQVAP